MLALPFRDGEVPTEAEIRVAKAQLVGWLEGLFHGIQATLFAQQLAARQQLEQMRQLPPGASRATRPPGPPMARPPGHVSLRWLCHGDARRSLLGIRAGSFPPAGTNPAQMPASPRAASGGWSSDPERR